MSNDKPRMVEITDAAELAAILSADSPEVPYPYEHEGRVYVLSDELTAWRARKSGIGSLTYEVLPNAPRRRKVSADRG